jgi:hypothetical protein
MERAVRIYKYSPPEVLTIGPVEVPLPGPGEALIRHTVIGLNFVEVYFRRGTFQVPAFPAVFGNDSTAEPAEQPTITARMLAAIRALRGEPPPSPTMTTRQTIALESQAVPAEVA